MNLRGSRLEPLSPHFFWQLSIKDHSDGFRYRIGNAPLAFWSAVLFSLVVLSRFSELLFSAIGVISFVLQIEMDAPRLAGNLVTIAHTNERWAGERSVKYLK